MRSVQINVEPETIGRRNRSHNHILSWLNIIKISGNSMDSYARFLRINVHYTTRIKGLTITGLIQNWRLDNFRFSLGSHNLTVYNAENCLTVENQIITCLTQFDLASSTK